MTPLPIKQHTSIMLEYNPLPPLSDEERQEFLRQYALSNDPHEFLRQFILNKYDNNIPAIMQSLVQFYRQHGIEFDDRDQDEHDDDEDDEDEHDQHNPLHKQNNLDELD